MSVLPNAPSSKSVSLKFSRGNSDPTTIGPDEIDESAERGSHEHGPSGRSQKPPPLPGTSADRSSRSAAGANISPLSPALDSDYVNAASSKARTAPPTTLQILAEVIAFAYQ